MSANSNSAETFTVENIFALHLLLSSKTHITTINPTKDVSHISNMTAI